MFEKILGRPLFGRDDDNAILPWWWHSQNLDERPGDHLLDGASGSKFMHGRGWLHMGKSQRRDLTLHVSWNLRSSFCHLDVRVDDQEHDVTFGLALPPVSLWLGMSGLPDGLFKLLGVDYESVRHLPDGCYLMERKLGISVHGWALWWSLWMPDGISKSTDPRWRRGSFHILDALFGQTKFSEVEIEQQAVLIPMPERTYRGTAKVSRRTRSRPRWPFRFSPLLGDTVLFQESLGYDVTMEDGEQIPVPGKGEIGRAHV